MVSSSSTAIRTTAHSSVWCEPDSDGFLAAGWSKVEIVISVILLRNNPLTMMTEAYVLEIFIESVVMEASPNLF